MKSCYSCTQYMLEALSMTQVFQSVFKTFQGLDFLPLKFKNFRRISTTCGQGLITGSGVLGSLPSEIILSWARAYRQYLGFLMYIFTLM